MADISKLEQQADLLFNNVAGWEQSTLQRIGKRIGKYGKMSLADVKAINNIAVVKSDMDAITKELAKVTGYNISQIEQMYGELLEEQHLANQPLYDYRGKKFVPFAENRELQAIARAYAKTTGETMINLAKTKALCVLGANGKPIGMQKYYTDVLGKAVMQVTTGATDFHTAMRDSIIELGGSGVRVDYGGGVTRRLDTVVRQNLLWGAKQASVEYNEMIGEELGCDGVEVDAHSNPRESHRFMQGQQYSLHGKKTINGVVYEDFEASGASSALQDYGCLHYRTPIICGISEPRYSPEELKRLNEQNAKTYEIDGKEYSGYDITQMQRRLESSVRNEKTTRELARASGDNALVKRCNERIKAYQGKYNEISETTGIQGEKKRMSVPRGTASVKDATPTRVEPPKPTFKKAETISQAEEYAKKFGVSADYSGYDLSVANEINKTMDKAIDEFGEHALDRLKEIRTYQKGEQTHAWGGYSVKEGRLALRGVKGKDAISKMGENLRTKYSPDMFSTQSDEHLIRHEVGHAIHDSLGSWADDEIREFMRGKITYSEISFYAGQDKYELFAECIAQYFNGTANDTVMEIIEIIKKGFRQKFLK